MEKRIMKKMLTILLTLAMLLSLAACGGNDEPTVKDKTTETIAEAPAAPAPTEPPKTVYADGSWTESSGNCTIDFLGAELFADDDGEQSLRVWFDFTNNTNKMKVHKTYTEQWKVTVADTGLNTMTGGRIKRIKKYLKPGEPFLMTYGDGLSDLDINALVDFHKSRFAVNALFTQARQVQIHTVDNQKFHCLLSIHFL
jgi:hypothetical protein